MWYAMPLPAFIKYTTVLKRRAAETPFRRKEVGWTLIINWSETFSSYFIDKLKSRDYATYATPFKTQDQ